MTTHSSPWLWLQIFMQRISLFVMVALAALLIGSTVSAALGWSAWLTLPLQFGEATYPMAGKALQIGAAAFAVGLCFYLPTNGRIMALERDHRDFNLRMEDVARAYVLAHAGDRAGLFTLSSEFDSVKERLLHLKDHPDLEELEPDVLELAAQMSHSSKELASIYSDDKVERARAFLRQRQQEVRRLEERIENARVITREIKHWQQQVEMDEALVASQLRRLQDDLVEVLAPLGLDLLQEDERKVVSLSKPERQTNA